MLILKIFFYIYKKISRISIGRTKTGGPTEIVKVSEIERSRPYVYSTSRRSKRRKYPPLPPRPMQMHDLCSIYIYGRKVGGCCRRHVCVGWKVIRCFKTRSRSANPTRICPVVYESRRGRVKGNFIESGILVRIQREKASVCSATKPDISVARYIKIPISLLCAGLASFDNRRRHGVCGAKIGTIGF